MAPRADPGPGRSTESRPRRRLDHAPGAEHRPLDRRPLGHHRAVAHEAGPDARPHRRPPGAHTRRRARAARGRRPGPGPVEQVAVGLQVGRRRPGVEPVGLVGQGEQRPSAAIAGNVSRSIETRRPAGMRSRTEGSST